MSKEIDIRGKFKQDLEGIVELFEEMNPQVDKIQSYIIATSCEDGYRFINREENTGDILDLLCELAIAYIYSIEDEYQLSVMNEFMINIGNGLDAINNKETPKLPKEIMEEIKKSREHS